VAVMPSPALALPACAPPTAASRAPWRCAAHHRAADTAVTRPRDAGMSAGALTACLSSQSAIAEFFMGSVTKYLVAKCEVPVVVLH